MVDTYTNMMRCGIRDVWEMWLTSCHHSQPWFCCHFLTWSSWFSLFVGIHTWETMRIIIVDSLTIRNNDWHSGTHMWDHLPTPAHPHWTRSKSQLRVKAAGVSAVQSAWNFCCCCCRIHNSKWCWQTKAEGGGNITQLATSIMARVRIAVVMWKMLEIKPLNQHTFLILDVIIVR